MDSLINLFIMIKIMNMMMQDETFITFYQRWFRNHE